MLSFGNEIGCCGGAEFVLAASNFSFPSSPFSPSSIPKPMRIGDESIAVSSIGGSCDDALLRAVNAEVGVDTGDSVGTFGTGVGRCTYGENEMREVDDGTDGAGLENNRRREGFFSLPRDWTGESGPGEWGCCGSVAR
jgi:hypothetical protein